MVDQVELGRRLRIAREASHLTQENVAQHLDLSRPSIAQIEGGKRVVTSLELEKLSTLFGRDMQDFFATEFEENPVAVLLRAQPGVAYQPGIVASLADYMKLGRELTELERVLGIHRGAGVAAAYSLIPPASRWEAIQQGERVAEEERRRLGIGWTPLADMSEFLEAQGVRTAVVTMPDAISGLTLSDPNLGAFVVINRDHNRQRRRFSHAHEYAHVLLDVARQRCGMVSLDDNRTNLVEVRANSFAACFLMPAEGVRQFMASFGKGQPGRFQVELFDENKMVPVEGRAEPGTQDIELFHVALLADFFGTSRLAALYRLRNLRLITDPELQRLKADDDRLGEELEVALGIKKDEGEEDRIRSQFKNRWLVLTLEAYRRQQLTYDRLIDLATMIGFQEELAQILGSDVLNPGGTADLALHAAR